MYNFDLGELDYIRNSTIDSKYIKYNVIFLLLNMFIYITFVIMDFYIHLKIEDVSINLFILMFSITFITGTNIILSLISYLILNIFINPEHYGIYKNAEEYSYEFNSNYIKSSKVYLGIKVFSRYSIYKVEDKYIPNNKEDIINRSKTYYDYINTLNRKTID